MRILLLLHGTNDTARAMAPLAARFPDRRVVAPDYGRHRGSLRGMTRAGGIGPLAESLAEILDTARTLGALDIVGHSQGGLHALALAHALPGQVGHVVLLGSPVEGVTPLGPMTPLSHRRPVAALLDAVLGPSARAQVRGAASALPTGPAPGVRYLLVTTDGDRTVPGNRAPHWLPVVRLQDQYPGARVSHTALASDPRVAAVVAQELAAPLT